MVRFVLICRFPKFHFQIRRLLTDFLADKDSFWIIMLKYYRNAAESQKNSLKIFVEFENKNFWKRKINKKRNDYSNVDYSA